MSQSVYLDKNINTQSGLRGQEVVIRGILKLRDRRAKRRVTTHVACLGLTNQGACNSLKGIRYNRHNRITQHVQLPLQVYTNQCSPAPTHRKLLTLLYKCNPAGIFERFLVRSSFPAAEVSNVTNPRHVERVRDTNSRSFLEICRPPRWTICAKRTWECPKTDTSDHAT